MSSAVSRQNRFAIALGIAVVFTLLFLVGRAWATSATLPGGEGSSWFVRDDQVTTNGAPTGGSCTTTGVSGSGAGTLDASIGFQGDAFDCATMAWVGGTQVGGLMVAAGNEAVFAPVPVSGLVAQMELHAVSTQSTLRVLLKLTNPTTSTIAVPVEYVNNLGSDGSTQVIASSSGDLAFGTDDRWLITDDFSTVSGDPTNTTVVYGPDSPPETTTAVSMTVFQAAGTEGTLARFDLEIAPGTQETLMFFQQLNPTATDAQTDVVQFDTTPPPGHPLTEGMTPDEFATIVNWDYGVERVPQHFTGYETNTGTPRFPSETLTLVDQFGTETVRRAEPRLLLTPTSKQRPGGPPEPIQRPDEHLKCYSLTGTIRQERTVRVSNQFGASELFVKEANRLCAPALKSTDPIPPGAEPEDTQHYKCYRVDETPRFSEDGVLLEDQFRAQVVDVRSAELLCNPVEKRRTGHPPVPPPRPDEHLVCYDLTERTPFTALNVFTRDQFGDQSLRVIDPDLLCVPSTKDEV
jgi:hypothetical protein